MIGRIRPVTLVALAVILIIGAVSLSSRHRGESGSGTAGRIPIVTLAPSASASAPTSPSASPSGSVDPRDPGGSQAVAVNFVTVWAGRGRGEHTDHWVARMSPYATKPLLDLLTDTDPSSIEAHRVTGPVTEVSKGEYGAQYVVPVDAGPAVLCGLTNDGASWRVTTISPIQPGQS